MPSESILELSLAGLPRVELTALPGSEALVVLFGTAGQHHISIYASSPVWRTLGYEFGTSLFTGVPLITNLAIDYLLFSTGFLDDGFTTTNGDRAFKLRFGSTSE